MFRVCLICLRYQAAFAWAEFLSNSATSSRELEDYTAISTQRYHSQLNSQYVVEYPKRPKFGLIQARISEVCTPSGLGGLSYNSN